MRPLLFCKEQDRPLQVTRAPNLGLVRIPYQLRLPEIARACLLALGAQLRTLQVQIRGWDLDLV